MRLHFQLSPNLQLVPFTYPHFLVGRVHRWLDKNALHDALSLYSIGWLQSGHGRKDGLIFPDGARWFISAPDTPEGDDLLSRIVSAAQSDPMVCCGMEVTQISAQRTPDFGPRHVFRADSPIFLRGDRTPDGYDPHLIYSDEAADTVLTRVLHKKLAAAGLSDHIEGATLRFDRSFRTPKTRLIQIQESKKRVTVCPVIAEGPKEAIQFVWNTGAGHLTGCAFGSLI
ncbi:CRISPR-associated protein Cas6 [bacterium]|nr:MAG: CRISPR-associated protein Cas6 [bacterium]